MNNAIDDIPVENMSPYHIINITSLETVCDICFAGKEEVEIRPFLECFLIYVLENNIINDIQIGNRIRTNFDAILKRLDYNKSGKLSILTIKQVLWRLPKDASVATVVEHVYDNKIQFLNLLPSFPYNYNDFELSTESILIENLGTRDIKHVIGPAATGKSVRLLSACSKFAKSVNVDIIWIDLRYEIGNETSLFSCILSQLYLYNATIDNFSSVFRKFLTILSEGSVLIFDHVDDEFCKKSMKSIFEFLDDFRSKFSIITVSKDGEENVHPFRWKDAKLIPISTLSKEESMQFAKRYSDTDANLIADHSSSLPGNIVALGSLSLPVLKKCLQDSSKSGKKLKSEEILVKVMTEDEKLCASCLAPLFGLNASFDEEFVWFMCKKHFNEKSAFKVAMNGLLSKCWLMKIGNGNSMIISSGKSLPSTDKSPSPANQLLRYLKYYSSKLANLNGIYRKGYRVVSTFLFDVHKNQFNRLLFGWLNSNVSNEMVMIALKLVNELDIFIETKYSEAEYVSIYSQLNQYFDVNCFGAGRSPLPIIRDYISYYYICANEYCRVLSNIKNRSEASQICYRNAIELKTITSWLNKSEMTDFIFGANSIVNGMLMESSDDNYRTICDVILQGIRVLNRQNSSVLPIKVKRWNFLALYYLATLSMDLEFFMDAEKLFEQSKLIALDIFGEDSVVYWDVCYNFAELFKLQEDYDVAEQMYLEFMEQTSAIFGIQSVEYYNSVYKYAVFQHISGRLEDAKSTYEKSIPIASFNFGELSPEIATIYNNLGALLDDLGDFTQARELYEKALCIRREVLEENHPDLAASVSNLAALLDDNGDYEQAKALYVEALSIYRFTLGTNHLDVASSMINLAAFLDDHGEWQEAKILYLEALDIFVAVNGYNDSSVASTISCLGHLCKREMKFDEARKHFEDCLAIYKIILGDDDLVTVQAMINLALLHKSQYQFQHAKILLEQALTIRRKLVGKYHAETLQVLRYLAVLMKAMKKIDVAIQLYREELEINRAIHGNKPHEDTVKCLFQLATLLKNETKFEESKKLYLEALDMQKQLYGEDSVQAADSAFLVATFFRSRTWLVEALELYLFTLNIYTIVYGLESLEVAKVQNDLGLIYNLQKKKDASVKCLEEALAIRQKLLPDKHPDVLQTISNLCTVCGTEEQYLDAKAVHDNSVKLRRTLHGDFHTEIAREQIKFAARAEQTGKYGEAKILYEQALIILTRIHGEDSLEVAECLLHLADILTLQRNIVEAEPKYELARELILNIKGQHCMEYANSNRRLAKLLSIQCKFHDSRLLLNKSLEILKSLSEGNSFTLDVARVITALANTYVGEGNYKMAESLFDEAIEIFQVVLGAEHIEVANVLMLQADVLKNQYYYDEARFVFSEALQIRRQVLGNMHLDVSQTLNSLGDIFKRQEMYEEASKCFEEAVLIRKNQLGEFHPDVAQGYHNLAAIFDQRGQLQESEELLREALLIRQKAHGDVHPDIAQTMNNLASILDDMGRPDEALPLYKAALAMYKELYGNDHPDVALSMNNMAALLDDRGEVEEALQLYEEALPITNNVYGENSLEVAAALICLGSAYANFEMFDKSLKCFSDAILIKSKMFGESHAHVAALNVQKAEVYVMNESYDEAIALLKEVISARSVELDCGQHEIDAINFRIEELEEEVKIYNDIEKRRLIPLAIVQKANNFMEQSYFTEAKELLHEAVKKFKKISLQSNDYKDLIETYQILFQCLCHLNKYHEAERVIKESLELKKKVFGHSSVEVAADYYSLGLIYEHQSKHHDAANFLKIALTILQDRLRDEDDSEKVEIAKISNSLASIYDDLGISDQAKPLYIEALRIYKALYGNTNVDVVLTMLNLAALYSDSNEFDLSQSTYLEACEISKDLYGCDSNEVADVLVCLGGVSKMIKDYVVAEKYFQDALYIKMKIFGPDHIEAAVLFSHIGDMLQSQKKYSEARQSFEESLAIRTSVFGDTHVEVAKAIDRIGLLLLEQLKVAEAITFFEKSLAVKKQHFLFANIKEEIAYSYVCIGQCLRKRKKYGEAISRLEKALRLYTDYHGATHRTVAETLCLLAAVRRSMQEYPESINLYERALEIQIVIYGEYHRLIPETLINLGYVFEKGKKYKEALARYERAYNIQRSLYGDADANIAHTLNLIASVHKYLKNYPLSEKIYQQVLNMRTALYGKHHADVAQSMNNLAALLYSLKRYDEAKVLYQDAITILTDIVGNYNLDVAQTMNNLAALYSSQKNFKEALTLYEKSLEIRRKLLGSKHIDVASSYYNIGILYKLQHEFAVSKDFFERAYRIRYVYYNNNANHPEVKQCQKHVDFVNQLYLDVAEGAVVDCQTRQTGNSKKRAKVVKVHTNNTYDVVYEDSALEKEKNVARYKITLLNVPSRPVAITAPAASAPARNMGRMDSMKSQKSMRSMESIEIIQTNEDKPGPDDDEQNRFFEPSFNITSPHNSKYDKIDSKGRPIRKKNTLENVKARGIHVSSSPKVSPSESPSSPAKLRKQFSFSKYETKPEPEEFDEGAADTPTGAKSYLSTEMNSPFQNKLISVQEVSPVSQVSTNTQDAIAVSPKVFDVPKRGFSSRSIMSNLMENDINTRVQQERKLPGRGMMSRGPSTRSVSGAKDEDVMMMNADDKPTAAGVNIRQGMFPKKNFSSRNILSSLMEDDIVNRIPTETVIAALESPEQENNNAPPVERRGFYRIPSNRSVMKQEQVIETVTKVEIVESPPKASNPPSTARRQITRSKSAIVVTTTIKEEPSPSPTNPSPIQIHSSALDMLNLDDDDCDTPALNNPCIPNPTPPAISNPPKLVSSTPPTRPQVLGRSKSTLDVVPKNENGNVSIAEIKVEIVPKKSISRLASRSILLDESNVIYPSNAAYRENLSSAGFRMSNKSVQLSRQLSSVQIANDEPSQSKQTEGSNQGDMTTTDRPPSPPKREAMIRMRSNSNLIAKSPSQSSRHLLAVNNQLSTPSDEKGSDEISPNGISKRKLLRQASAARGGII